MGNSRARISAVVLAIVTGALFVACRQAPKRRPLTGEVARTARLVMVRWPDESVRVHSTALFSIASVGNDLVEKPIEHYDGWCRIGRWQIELTERQFSAHLHLPGAFRHSR